MARSRDFIGANVLARERVAALAASLSDSDWGVPLDGDWTVGAGLAHLAYWENWFLVLAGRFLRTGSSTSLRPDADAMNDAMLPLLLAAPRDETVASLIEAMTQVDSAIASMSDAQLESIGFDRHYVNLFRSGHRDEHAAEIMRAVPRLAT